jgi:hypothetical protein
MLKKIALFNIFIFYTISALANELVISGGKFDIQRHPSNKYEIGLEHRWEEKIWKIKPLVGAFVNNKSGGFIYAGIGVDFILYKNLFAGINIAPGYYHKGNGKNLGGPFEIKSQFELGWAFTNNYKISAAIYHMSNAGIYKNNPGLESVVLQLFIPI